jgi:hypothetical protein
MLSGIPEIDLGMEAKIRNIEATEAAKNKILLERMKKKDLPSEFVPTNMAVNFVQHNRCEFYSQPFDSFISLYHFHLTWMHSFTTNMR